MGIVVTWVLLAAASIATIVLATKAPVHARLGVRAAGAAVLGITVLWVGLSCTTTIKASVAVPVSYGKPGAPVGPGLQLHAPWVEMEVYPARPVQYCLNDGAPFEVRTQDKAQVTAVVCAQYAINGFTRPLDFSAPVDGQAVMRVYNLAKNAEQLRDNHVKRGLENSTAAVFATVKWDEVVGGTKTNEMSGLLAAELKALENKGILITDVLVGTIQPGANLNEAIDRKVKERENTAAAVEEKNRKAIENETAIADATAKAEAGRILSGTLSREALCQAWIEKNAGVTQYTAGPCGALGAGSSSPQVIVDNRPR